MLTLALLFLFQECRAIPKYGLGAKLKRAPKGKHLLCFPCITRNHGANFQRNSR